jgi:peroxiredoxin
MSKTASTMLALGTSAPDFSLPDVCSGRTVSRSDFTGHPLAVWFICAHCPFVKHVERELAAIAQDYAGTELRIVAVSANSVQTHPQDAPDELAAQAHACGFVMPYLYDETQEAAKAYTAACTPDFFLFDSGHTLVYRGQLDASRPGNEVPVTGRDLRAAIDQVLAGQPVNADQAPSIGCNIKWHPGREPEYFGNG